MSLKTMLSRVGYWAPLTPTSRLFAISFRVQSVRASAKTSNNLYENPLHNERKQSNSPELTGARKARVYSTRTCLTSSSSNVALQRPRDGCISSKLSMRGTLIPVRCKRLLFARLRTDLHNIKKQSPQSEQRQCDY